jgi:RNA polymerase sigma-70 factor (ECF subfamily)
VLSAGREDATNAGAALEKLCRNYWFPLYAYVRRHGYSPHDAQDLTQGFFESLLRRRSLARVDPNRGRFRSFMLGAMNHFLADHGQKSRAQKRGGQQPPPISLELAAAEKRFDLEPASNVTPDIAFEREWATTLLESVVNQLEDEYVKSSKADLFVALKGVLAAGAASVSYADIAGRLNMTEGNLRVAAHRLRKRYRELLRTEIAKTVSSSEEIKDEMRHLFKTMSDS